ncbi:Uncharacterised protein [Bacteroides xylanisolvens]|nr:Uncharacterised protein [Bacteroides xylanisolvens]
MQLVLVKYILCNKKAGMKIFFIPAFLHFYHLICITKRFYFTTNLYRA